jgi:hypothetical protein
MKKALSVVLVIAFILSCNTVSKKSKIEPICLKDTIFVKPEILKSDKLFSVIWNIKIHDSILLLMSPDGRGSVQLLNKNSGKFISTKCIEGRGPGEFSDYVDLTVIADSIFIYDPTKNSISVYKTDAFLNNSLSNTHKEIIFQKHRVNFDAFPLEGYYVSKTGTGPRLALFNRNGKHISDYQLFSDFYKDVKSQNHIQELLQCFIVDPKPDLSKFVSISYIGGVLEIFKIENDTIKQILEKRFLDPNLKIKREDDWLVQEDTKIGFFGLYTTDNYIYTSYSGLTSKEFREIRIMDYIIVFDWEGNVKRIYKVEGGLKGLAADEAEGKIYVVTKDSEGVDAVGVINM